MGFDFQEGKMFMGL